jgi:hypothetical protein
MSIYYNVAKDFVGPAATFVAALVAAAVTWHFNRIQTEIARSQKELHCLKKTLHSIS